jgi:hypothetical protein
MGGRPVWWLPGLATAERALAQRLDRLEGVVERAVLATIGAGDVFELAEALVSEPAAVQEPAR